MSINDLKKARRSLTMAILTTLLISGTATTAALSFQTGSVYGQGLATLRVVKQVICELPSICPITPENFRITVTSSNPTIRPNPASFDGSSEGTTVSLGLGTFSVTETAPNPPAGLLSFTSSRGCTGSFIAPGQTRECRIINAYLQPGGDTDGDSLSNSWEINGIDQNNDGRIDFRIPNANPLHKNLYIETDYMQFHQPISAGIDNVINAFSIAPVSNPDGTRGINLFVQVDEEIPHQNAINGVTGLLAIKRTNFGTVAERADPNSANILAAKRLVFHYGPFVHDRSDFPGSSGVSNGAPGMEFFVSLGGNWGLAPVGPMGANHSVGTLDQQEGTFMHEFGHNLGLEHGGNETINCKPNYLSLMSYSFQMSNLVSTRPLDYSRSALAPLNENNLNEPNGISPSDPPGLTTIYGPRGQGKGPGFNTTTGVPIDWNYNKIYTDRNVISNINGGLDGNDCDGIQQNLKGFNDWNALVYTTTPAEALSPFQVQQLEVPEEQTSDDLRESRIILLEGIDNAILRIDEHVPPELNTSHIAELLQTDQLASAIVELNKLKAEVIAIFGQVAAAETVFQIENLIGALEKQMPSSPPSPPPASACIGTGSRDTVITGTPGPDTLIGTDGHNRISGLGGDDSINGCGNVDVINGGTGNDGIAGGPARDLLHGNEGDDIVQGDSGDDVIYGDAGINTLTGGPGRDIFFCSPEGETTITDFVPGVDTFRGPCILGTTTTTTASPAESSTPTADNLPSQDESTPRTLLSLPLPT
jgi:hypothetical protein